VALVELGRGPAALALTLDLQPRHTVAEVHSNWERLDATFLRQSMLAHPGGVQILSHKAEALAPDPLPPQAVRKSVILLRTIFSAAVLDLGHVIAEEQVEALRLCDSVAVVVRLDVPALRQARRFLRLLGDRGVPRDRIRLVANRYGQRGEVAWKKAEEAIGGSFAAYVSEDAGKVNAALNQGQPLVKMARYAGITRRFYKLVEQFNGRSR
jgi:pilus assembly protein CpaE